MNDIDPLDERLTLAFTDVRDIEPTDRQVRTAVAAASQPRLGGVGVRRAVGIGAASLTVATATAFAVPQSREAILDAAGAFGDFLTGGGDPPGDPLAPGERAGVLNWFYGSDTTTGNVIAEAGGVRIIAYRQAGTDLPCIEWGLVASECRRDHEWSQLLNEQVVYAPAIVATQPRPDGIPLVGIAADRVTSARVEYADGSLTAPVPVDHGFIVFADPARRPVRLIARDAGGTVLATLDVSRYQWTFPGRLNP